MSKETNTTCNLPSNMPTKCCPDRKYQPVPVPTSLVVLSTLIHVSFYCIIGLMVSIFWTGVEWHRVLQCAYLSNCTALFTHWMGHQKIRSVPFLHRWYQAHLDHHVKEYPPTRFLSDENYRPAPVNNAYAYRSCAGFIHIGVWPPMRYISCRVLSCFGLPINCTRKFTFAARAGIVSIGFCNCAHCTTSITWATSSTTSPWPTLPWMCSHFTSGDRDNEDK